MTVSEFKQLLEDASSLEEKGSYHEAERLLMEVVASLERSGPDEIADRDRMIVQSEAKRLLGVACTRRGDYSQALEFFNAALHANESINRRSGIVRLLTHIGAVHQDLSDFQSALQSYSTALSISEEIGDKARIGRSLGKVANVYCDLSDYPRALEYYAKGLSIAEELGNKEDEAEHLTNMAIVYWLLNEFSQALEYNSRALRLAEELGSKGRISACLNTMGIVFSSLKDNAKALEYYNQALSILEEIGIKSSVGMLLGNIGSVHHAFHDYRNALEYYEKALTIAEELDNKSAVARHRNSIGSAHMRLGDYQKAHEYLESGLQLYTELGMKSEIGAIKLSIGDLYADLANPKFDESNAEMFLLEGASISQELGTKKYGAHKSLADLYEKQERWKEAYYHQAQYLKQKEEVLSEDARNTAQILEQQKQVAKQEKETAIAKAAADAKLSATTGLLYKVLPQSVATRMIDGEAEIADYFPQVSILFADIAGFTPISADMPAIVVVRFLNYVFGEFDRIIKKHGCEKIKTIGDGYMAVCGAPVECADHAERLAAAALEMQQTISLPESIAEFMPSGVEFGIRIGLHTGSVVAGVIGEERFVYDIYSDAVNTAARMESHGEENRIHCSNDFYRHLQNRFAMTKNTSHGFVFEKRGEMEIKGKGMMRTYFLETA